MSKEWWLWYGLYKLCFLILNTVTSWAVKMLTHLGCFARLLVGCVQRKGLQVIKPCLCPCSSPKGWYKTPHLCVGNLLYRVSWKGNCIHVSGKTLLSPFFILPCMLCDLSIQRCLLMQLLSTYSNLNASISSSKDINMIYVVAHNGGKDEKGTKDFKSLKGGSSMLTPKLLNLILRSLSPCQVPAIISGQLLWHNKSIPESQNGWS